MPNSAISFHKVSASSGLRWRSQISVAYSYGHSQDGIPFILLLSTRDHSKKSYLTTVMYSAIVRVTLIFQSYHLEYMRFTKFRRVPLKSS